MYFIIWLILSSVIGANWEHSFFGNYFRRGGIITWIGYFTFFIASGAVLSTQVMRKNLSAAICISAGFVAILGIFQFISLHVFSNQAQLLYSGRIISTFGQPNFLGSFLVMSLPFFWYLDFILKYKLKYAVRLVGVLATFALIATLSRSSILAFFVLMIIWGVRNTKIFLKVLVAAVVLIIVLYSFFPKIFLNEANRFSVDFGNKWTAENRSLIAKRSLDLIIKRPISGWGADNFILVFPGVLEFGDFGLKDIVVDSAHNIFLDIGVEAGFVGLFIFLLLVFSVFFKATKDLKTEDPLGRRFLVSMIMVILAFIVSHQFSVLSVVPAVIFWICMGAIAGSVFDLNYKERSYKKISIPIISSVIILASCFLFITANIKSDMLFKQASFYEISDIERAISLDAEAIRIAPWVNFYSWRKNFLLKQSGNE
jgi:O-antigen ligase